VIQLGTRFTRSALLAAAALGSSTTALAQTTPAPPPQPTETPTNPVTVDPNAPALTPLPAPTPTEPAPAPTPTPAATVFPTMAGPNLRLSDLFSIRIGILIQVWATAAQDALPKADGSSGDFAENIYIRRGRFFVGGGLGKNLRYFILTETSNSGLPALNADGTVTKNFTNFIIEDAFFDYKPNKFVSFQAGLQLVPFTRNILQSTGTYWAVDVGAVSATYIAATQTSVLRDTGFQVKVNALDSKLEVRGMVSQGVRLSDGAGRAPGKNDPRLTAYAQYNFLDPEDGYVFNGQYFGRKKVAGISAGIDYQKTGDENPYFATSATLFGAIPIHGTDAKNGDDEFGGQIEYLHFHNGRIPAAQLGKQDDLLVELGYYNKAAKFSVFGKYEGRFFNSDDFLAPGVKLNVQNTQLYGGGVKYFFAEAAANLTLQYNYTTFPNQPSEARNSISTIQLAAQLAYY
jgi:hypothetical protein